LDSITIREFRATEAHSSFDFRKANKSISKQSPMGKANTSGRINPSNIVESGKESEEDSENAVRRQRYTPISLQ
jgi:hypothetical protein